MATYTRLAIPEGTSIEIFGAGHTTIVWEGRDASCSTWNDAGFDEAGPADESQAAPVLSLTKPDSPVLTVNTGPDTTIYLEEVAR